MRVRGSPRSQTEQDFSPSFLASPSVNHVNQLNSLRGLEGTNQQKVRWVLIERWLATSLASQAARQSEITLHVV